MSDLGSLSTYLGIEIKQMSDYISLSQGGYARHILEKKGLQNCNSSQTPFEARAKFSKNGGGSRVDPTAFRSIVGSLRYLTHTRPDLLYSVGILSRYMETPTSDHLSAANMILRYVKGTIDFGLIYLKCQVQDTLFGYSDSHNTRISNVNWAYSPEMLMTEEAPQGMHSSWVLPSLVGDH